MSEYHRAYWRANINIILSLLFVWAIVSFGFGIILVDELNQIRISGFKLGFWFAQQGSIYVFVILIFVYVGLMNRLDKKFNVDEESDAGLHHEGVESEKIEHVDVVED